MQDIAHKWTDEQLSKLEKKISNTYRKALKELKAEQKKFMSGYDEKLKHLKEQLQSGVISKEEFTNALRSFAITDRRIDEMVKTFSSMANKTNQIAQDMINGQLPEYYAENFNWGTYTIEKGTRINTAFNLLDADTVYGMTRDNPSLLPEYILDKYKDIRWNQNKFNSAILQGILQGESIPNIARRLGSVMQMNHNSAIRNARTATTSAENRGRIDSYNRAKNMGIKLKKEWLATLDGRTRHSHRQLDGVAIEVDEVFDNGCRFPGDPQAQGFEVYNCRCTLIAKFDDVDTSDARRSSKLGNMSYKEWKKQHE